MSFLSERLKIKATVRGLTDGPISVVTHIFISIAMTTVKIVGKYTFYVFRCDTLKF